MSFDLPSAMRIRNVPAGVACNLLVFRLSAIAMLSLAQVMISFTKALASSSSLISRVFI